MSNAARPTRRGWLALVLSLGIASGLLAACGGDDAAAGGEVVLYTSIPDSVIDQIQGVIERRFPDLEGDYWLPVDSEGITLRVVRGRTADIEQLIADEITSGRIEADLIWLAEPSPYESYKELALLAPYAPPAGAPIPADYIDADGLYVAGRIISMVLAWNTRLQPDGLADWPDLRDAESAAFPAPPSGAARATIKGLTNTYGEGFFTEFVDRGGVTVASNGEALRGVAGGAYGAVGVLDYMAREAKAAGSAVDFAYPAGGTVLIPSPIAITTDSRNPAAARAVVDFILSKPGQQIIVEIGNFYPVRTDVAPPEGAPPLAEIPLITIDWAAFPDEIDSITALWDRLFGP